MVPVEWPIAAAPAEGGGTVPAPARDGRRLSIVRLDFFLDPRGRLTEQERALMTAMLSDLVGTMAEAFAEILADAEPANDDGDGLFDRLWASGLLDIPDLIALLLRRAEEERIAAGILAGSASGRARFLQSLVSDADGDVSACAMALILARARRRDRFDGPRLTFDDVPAEAAVMLVNAVASALRGILSERLGERHADERLAGAAQALLATHDEAERLEAKLFDLVHALDRSGRVDDALVRSAVEEGEVALVTEILARGSEVGFDSAWESFTGGGEPLALLLRMAAIDRALAGDIIARTAHVRRGDAESEIHAFDSLGDDEVESARSWLRLDQGYRSAVAAIGTGHGERTV